MPTPQSPASQITGLDASALSQAIHSRQVSCREVMQAYLQRIGISKSYEPAAL